ncbi:MAG: class I SAM-dependent methyltransferase [Chthoniobacterales bacterium]|nr:class I SAM-dependent methyltransferase [Chthoniobacterales bacterium]
MITHIDPNTLSKIYQNRFPKDQLEQKNKIWQILCRNLFQKFISSSATVVDVACGYGEFINNISAHKKIAIDLNQDALKFLDSDIEFHQCEATKLSSAVKGTADVLFTSNFLEHLSDKNHLDAFLDEVMIALKPGGIYMIMGPNLRYLPAQYWDFYDHHLGLTHLSLIEALRLKSFDVTCCVKRFLPFTTQSRLPKYPFFVWAYLKCPLVWNILGKQFFIIAQKPLSPC